MQLNVLATHAGLPILFPFPPDKIRLKILKFSLRYLYLCGIDTNETYMYASVWVFFKQFFRIFNQRFCSNMFSNQVFLVSCRSTCHRFPIIINYLFGFFSVCFPRGFAFGCKPVWLFTIQDHFTCLNSRLDALSLQGYEL